MTAQHFEHTKTKEPCIFKGKFHDLWTLISIKENWMALNILSTSVTHVVACA